MLVGDPVGTGGGAQVFNLLNHPKFDQPVGDIANPQFGSIIRTVGLLREQPTYNRKCVS